MTAIDFLWHLGNLFAMAVLFAAVAAVGAKLIWRRRYAGWRFARLLGAAVLAAAAAVLLGLLLFGRDGRMAGYGLMLLAVTGLLGWAGRRGV